MSAPTWARIIVFIILAITSSLVLSGKHITSQLYAEQKEKRRCGIDLKPLWTSEVSHSPFAAPPLIVDANADGELDVVVAPFTESLTTLQAENAKVLPDSMWPSHSFIGSTHSSPLQFDIDGDGLLDLLFTSTNGELLFYSGNGKPLIDYTFQIPPVYVKQNWFNEVLSVSHKEISQYLSKTQKDGYLSVGAHVLSTPVIVDINNDKRIEELVVSVSYYIAEEDERLFDSSSNIANSTDHKNYVVSGIAVVNVTTLSIISTTHFEISKKSSEFPAYNLFSPTVISLDGGQALPDIITTTSAGNLYVMKYDGQLRTGFPVSSNSLVGQATAADINNNGDIDIITLDVSGIVMCIDKNGETLWESEIDGKPLSGCRLADVNKDDNLDVIITTNTGNIYALNGKDGKVLENWPMKIGHRLPSNLIVTKISKLPGVMDMVFLSDDGVLHVVTTDQSCNIHFPISETSLVQILAYDIIPWSNGIELLVATNDGTIICLGSGIQGEEFPDEDIKKLSYLVSVPSEIKTPNDFTFSLKKNGVVVSQFSRYLGEVTSSTFPIGFEIFGEKKSFTQWTVRVYYGRNLLAEETYSDGGEKVIHVPSSQQSGKGHITLLLTNENHQIYQDSFVISFHQQILLDLQWLLLTPFIAMVTIIMVNHGFPAKDLLPLTLQSKKR